MFADEYWFQLRCSKLLKSSLFYRHIGTGRIGAGTAHWTRKMQISKNGVLIIASGVILAAIPPAAWYLFSGTVTMSGNIVLTNGSPENILQHGLGRLILFASSMIVIGALTFACLYEKHKTASLKRRDTSLQ